MYVSRHDSDGVLTVKLGDSGIPDFSDPAEIYFIPIEMFTDRNHTKCTMKGKYLLQNCTKIVPTPPKKQKLFHNCKSQN